MSIINEEVIFNLLESKEKIEDRKIDEILNKALDLKGLDIHETAMLLKVDDDYNLGRIFDTARKVKEKVFGRRMVFFVPLYITNECINNCLYCGFRAGNRAARRATLSDEEIIKEVRAIENMGFKRILLVFGEHPERSNPDFIFHVVKKIYHNSGIRILHINSAPFDVEGFKIVKNSGVGVYQLFQETYHRDTYGKMHMSGKKADYDWRITAFDRAFEGGFHDIGMGILYGLYDYKFEILALLQHVAYLRNRFGIGPHTISIPRLRPAEGSVLTEIPYPVSDIELKKIVAILRLAVPYAGIVLSTRERAELRDVLLDIGISQMSAGSKVNPGGYEKEDKTEQFAVHDSRNLREIILKVIEKGYLPSLCTACYRVNRVGDVFNQLAEEGKINRFCTPNAILTLKEYLLDYGKDIKDIGEKTIYNFLMSLDEDVRREVFLRLQRIEKGERDLYF